MRKLITSFLASLAVFLAVPTTANALDVNVDGMLDEVLVGANGIATSPIDVAYGLLGMDRTYDLPILGDKLSKVPVISTLSNMAGGLATGVVNAVVRAGTGGADIFLAPVDWILDQAGNPLQIEFGNPFSPCAKLVLFGPAQKCTAEE